MKANREAVVQAALTVERWCAEHFKAVRNSRKRTAGRSIAAWTAGWQRSWSSGGSFVEKQRAARKPKTNGEIIDAYSKEANRRHISYGTLQAERYLKKMREG